MLQLVIPPYEQWDEEREMFIVNNKEQKLMLEHSLVSLSKWESKWNKPFLSSTNKTAEETLDYIRCMTVSQNIPPEIYNLLTMDHIKQINDYIDLPMTATTFSDRGPKGQREIITSEIIYFWMISYNIPMECQKWHLNRLLTLIKVCDVKNQPQKKMGRKEMLNQNAALNAARRKQYNTKG